MQINHLLKILFASIATIPIGVFAQSDTITLYYDIDAHNANKDELNKLVVADDWQMVSIISYTDYLGSDDYNIKLSERRARAARSRLIQRGLSSDQLKEVEGRGITGETLESSEGIQENRRTDILVWKNTEPITEIDVTPNPQLEQQEEVIEAEESLAELVEATEVGSNLVIQNLSFIPGHHYLEESSYPTLDTLIQLMKDKPHLKIAIEGHICCEINLPDGFDQETGTQTLSVERAKYIYTRLISQGIEEERLSYEGFGRQRPIFPDELDEEQQQANRRVEIKIIEK